MSLAIDGVWKAGVWATTAWADGVWSEGATEELTGRKRRRGIYRPRKREEWVDLEAALKDLKKQRAETAELLALTQSELKTAELIADNAVNRNIRIEQLNLRITELEWNLRRVKDEEEMLITFAIMEL